ncbi:hypothetical protein GLT92_00425 [Nanohaloarchaea archaeon]|nr:hypothetical protein [Candidatus Nanohaloarchaea archaeon]
MNTEYKIKDVFRYLQNEFGADRKIGSVEEHQLGQELMRAKTYEGRDLSVYKGYEEDSTDLAWNPFLILPDNLYSGYDWIVSVSNSDLRTDIGGHKWFYGRDNPDEVVEGLREEFKLSEDLLE